LEENARVRQLDVALRADSDQSDGRSPWRELGLTSKSRGVEASATKQRPRREERGTADDRGRLLADIAHEVRNPLFSISATADAIETRISGSDPVIRQHMTNLRQEITRLNTLMLDLVEYGRPPKLIVHAGSLPEMIAQAVRRVQKQASERELRIVNEILQHDSLVPMDQERLTSAFESLLQNAISYSPAGEAVLLRLVAPDAAEGKRVSFEIQDRGSYIRPEELPHLFEPFFLRRLGGTGLSLPRARQVIELHGGEIRARNRAEGGVAVTITLPTSTGD
jgi:signal transduction histidine kinase